MLTHTILLLCSSGLATNFSALPPELYDHIVKEADILDKFSLGMTSKSFKERVDRVLLETNVMRKDTSTSLVHPDYTSHWWSSEQLTPVAFKLENRFPRTPYNPEDYEQGASITNSYGNGDSELRFTTLVQLSGYADFMLRMLREERHQLTQEEFECMMFSPQFSNADIKEAAELTGILDEKPELMKVICSMAEDYFDEKFAYQQLEQGGCVPYGLFVRMIRSGYWSLLTKITENLSIDGSDISKWAVEQIYDAVDAVPYPNWRRYLLDLQPEKELVALHLADESGDGILNCPSTVDLNSIFKNLFGKNEFAKRLAREIKETHILLNPGLKKLVERIREHIMSQEAYLTLLKGLASLFETCQDEHEQYILSVNAAILLNNAFSIQPHDCRVLLREILINKHLPFELKEGITHTLCQKLKKTPIEPLLESLVRIGADAESILILLKAFSTLQKSDLAATMVYLHLFAVSNHPRFKEIAKTCFKHVLDTGLQSGLCSTFLESLNQPTYILKPLASALGEVIHENFIVRELPLHSLVKGISPRCRYTLWPLIFDGILTPKEIHGILRETSGSGR